MSKRGASAQAAGAPPPFFGASDEATRARTEWLEHGLSVKDWSARLRELDPRLFFRRTWRVLDEVAADERAGRAAAKGYDYRPIIAMCVGASCLTVMEYFGHSVTFRDLLHWLAGGRESTEVSVWSELRDSRWLALSDFVWWSSWRVLGYFVVPALVVKWWFKERLRDHGLETSGIRHHAWIYVLSYGAVFAGVMFVAAFVPHFTEYYPFYDFCSRSWFDLIAWELLYAAQFLSLEFFFRGFWMRSMRTSMGSHAIFAMVVPYCMIHFGKPFLEAMAAIFAGVVLGTLALRTRSIWGGCVVHIGVAITMDITALIVSGRGLPVQWWPG